MNENELKEIIKQAIKEEREESEREELVKLLCKKYGLHCYDHFNFMSLQGLKNRIRIDYAARFMTGEY